MHDTTVATTALLILLAWGGVGALFFWDWFLRDALRRFRRRSRLSQALVALGIAALVVIGGIKSGPPPLRTPPPDIPPPSLSTNQCLAGFALVAADTNADFSLNAPTNAVVHTNWLLRGASRDAFAIESTAERPWSFRLGTNRLRRVWVAAGGTVSFAGPFDSATGPMPDASAPDHLAPFHATLGIVPAANWHLLPTNAPVGLWTFGLSDYGLEATGPASCFWHDTTEAGSLRLTWRNALFNRDAASPVSFQTELFPSGDFIYRYDFGGTAPTSAVIGAQNNGGGETWTNAASAQRVELRWRHFSGIEPGAADTDGDGLSNYDEVFVHGTDPARADSDGDDIADGVDSAPNNADANGDGIPDGATAAAWTAHPFLAENAGFTNLVLTVVRGMAPPLRSGNVPGASALLDVGGLKISLRTGDAIPLGLPGGVEITANLRVRGNLPVRLQLSPGPNGEPFRLIDPQGVFSHGTSTDATARMSFPLLSLVPLTDTGTCCLHEGDTGAEFQAVLLPSGWDDALAAAEIEGFERLPGGTLWLNGPEPPFAANTGTVAIRPPWLRWGTLSASASVHWCASGGAFCHACDTVHTATDSCTHDANCAARFSDEEECDCTPIFLRVNFDDDDFNDVEDRNETPDAMLDDELGEFRFVGIGDCCCETWQRGDSRARIAALSPGLRLWSAAGTRLLSGDEASEAAWIEATARSMTNGTFSLSYDILDPTGGVVRAMSRRFTAANVEILPDMDENGVFDVDDRLLRETLGPGGTWKVVRREEPGRVRLRNACPEDATLRVLWSTEGTNGPAFSTDSNLTTQYLAPNAATTNSPFALPNLVDEFLIDASRTSSVATLTYSLDVGEASPAVADSLAVRIVDIDLPDRTIRPSELASGEYDLSAASTDVSWTLYDAATATEIDWWYGPVYQPPTNLSCGDYEVSAYVWDVWEDGAEGTYRTATLRVADIAIEREAYAVQVGSTSRVRVALDASVSTNAANWSITPSGNGAPLLYTSETGGTGFPTLSNAAEAWIGAETNAGVYSLTARNLSATNITASAAIHSIRFELSHTNMVMRERGASTNVLHVVSSDGAMAEWKISQDAQYQFDYPKAQLSATEGGSGKTVSNASRVWITPGVSNVEYTVTATHREWTNIIASANLKVCQVYLKPITPENYGGTNYNPCAVANGLPGRFKITVEPQSFVPDADIEWVSSPLLTSLFNDCHSGTGRVVNVLPIGIGTTRTLRVNIRDFIGPPPEITYEAVGPETTILVRVFCIRDNNGRNPGGLSSIDNILGDWFNTANSIFSQAGIKFLIHGSIDTIDNSNWYSIDHDNQYDYDRFTDEMFLSTPSISMLKVYVIDSFLINGNDLELFAITGKLGHVSFGTIIPIYMDGISFAHELGHACGLPDIYWTSAPMISPGQTVISVSGVLQESDASMDWTGESNYYQPGFSKVDVIKSLLMFGAPDASDNYLHRDIPLGPIYGVSTTNYIDFSTSPVGIGLDSLIRQPITYGGTP